MACGAFLEGKAAAAAAAPGIPWENRGSLGLWTAGWETLKQVLLAPTEAYGKMRLPASLGDAMIFFVIFGGGGAVVGALWGAVLQNLMQHWMMSLMTLFLPQAATMSSAPSPFSPQAMLLLQGGVGMIMAPFGAVLGMMICGLLGHLGLLMTGAPRKDLGTTLAVYAYAMGAAGIFHLLPLGWLIAMLWAPVCYIAGLIRVHGCKTWQGVVAALWWHFLLLCCCGGVAIVAALCLPPMMASFPTPPAPIAAPLPAGG